MALTHAQKTQIRLAFAKNRHPADIAAELGVPKSEVDQCLQSSRPKTIKPWDPDKTVVPHRRKR